MAAEARRADLRFPFPDRLAERLTGASVTALTRRAKYLLIETDRGETFISHLGMSGSWRVEQGEETAVPGVFHHPRSDLGTHDHLVLKVEGGAIGPARLVYNDPRRFGFFLATPTASRHEHPMLRDLGPEPMGNALRAEHLAAAFAGKRAPLKAALLDQKVVAGLGNIYVCEALSRAKLSPKRLAGTLVTKAGKPTARLERLAAVIPQIIAEAIEAGGSSLRDHKHTDGSLGYFQHRFGVYDRLGEACPNAVTGCRGTVQRIVQSGRSTFYCPTCQR